MSTPKKPACGGKGPCCHIGYSHRHCEHCDMVIDTRPANWSPYVAPYVAPTPYRPYQPYWGSGLGAGNNNAQINFGDVLNSQLDALRANAVVASQVSPLSAACSCEDTGAS